MAGNKRNFDDLFKQGVRSIKAHSGTNIEIIKAELAGQLNISISMIDHWYKGKGIPTKSQPQYVFTLTKEFVERGKMDEEWTKQFFIAAGYPTDDNNHKGWFREIFPDVDFETESVIVTENASSTLEGRKLLAEDSGENYIDTGWWQQYILIGSICCGLVVIVTLYLLLSQDSQKFPIFADSFDDAQSSQLNWTMNTSEHAFIEDGRLWFDVPLNANSVWNAEILEMLMEDNKYFSRVDFSIQLEAIPDQKNGYIGVQTDCDKGWLIARVGDTPPAFFVEYSQSAEEDDDFNGIIVNRLASVDTGKEYNVAIVWDQKEATITLDNQVQSIVPCLPSRFFAVFAGLPLETSVHGFVDNIQIWD
ncbi:MAG: hypothetical protein KDD62_01065 [Bdellovibrionales bacterium]|nr:hypothetical protein [Bdellovibrionales bacterium]